jgi:anthraniloyl-CoA monooxygenase
MTVRRVGILGGGPAGLYTARLLKLRAADLEVTVYERNHPGETFGFGIALTGATQSNLATADQESYRAMTAVGRPIAAQEFRLPGSQAVIRAPHSLGIGRSTLLRVLLDHARRIGVRLAVGPYEAAQIDADVVLACDGANSATRAALATELGEHVEVGRWLYLWCGTDLVFPHNAFIPVSTEHGMFVAHVYPYASDRSTFFIETDEDTWCRAGFDATTAALDEAASAASDETSIAYLQQAFAQHLEGHRLLGNRTRWLRFRAVSCRRWHSGRTALLGDAAHTAHFSLGSGTKLAMEDAIALTQVLPDADDVAAAFTAYEMARRPAVTRLQRLAHRSQLWWEGFPERTGLPAETVAIAFMTRAGNVSLERLQSTNRRLLSRGLRHLGEGSTASMEDDPAAWVLDRPLQWGRWRFPSRVLGDPPPAGYAELGAAHPEAWRTRKNGAGPLVAVLPVDVRDCWSPQADAVVTSVRRLLAHGCHGVRVTGSPDRDALLDRLALSERLCRETDALVVVDGPEELREDLAAGLASHRADLIGLVREPSVAVVGRTAHTAPLSAAADRVRQ